MGVKVKKQKGKTAEPAGVEVESAEVVFHGAGEKLFHVALEKAGHSALVRGDTKADAEDAFKTLFGILSTDHRIRVSAVDEDDHGYTTDGNGVIVPERRKPKRTEDDE